MNTDLPLHEVPEIPLEPTSCPIPKLSTRTASRLLKAVQTTPGLTLAQLISQHKNLKGIIFIARELGESPLEILRQAPDVVSVRKENNRNLLYPPSSGTALNRTDASSTQFPDLGLQNRTVAQLQSTELSEMTINNEFRWHRHHTIISTARILSSSMQPVPSNVQFHEDTREAHL